MRSFLIVVLSGLLAACGPIDGQSEPPPETEASSVPEVPASLGPDGVKLGDDIRLLPTAMFRDYPGPFRRVTEHCREAQSVAHCNELMGATHDSTMQVPSPLSGRIVISGMPASIHIFFDDQFKITTIDINLGEINQPSYESVLATLANRYAVEQASQSQYDAYNSAGIGCLANRNASHTVFFALDKAPTVNSSTTFGGGPDIRVGASREAAHVIYTLPDASNSVTRAVRHLCLALDASGL
nr:hypothetical protein [Nitrosomonas nitrosa]